MSERSNLIQTYRWLRQYGLNDSHSGNASVLEENRLWITPTGACADTLTEKELVSCALDTNPPPGASLDAPLHQAVYRTNPDVRAILHSHCPHTVALTLSGDNFQPIDFEGAYYFGRVTILDIPYERYTEDSPQRVAEILRENRVTVVRGHGVYAAAESLNLAYKWSCSLELSARTAWLAHVAGTTPGT